MNIARSLVLMIAFGVLSVPVCAEPTEIIAVQIGTYKQFAAEAKQSVSHFGVVHVLTYENLSRVTVGEFTDRQQAAHLLEKLKQAGYEDAFIRKIGFADLDKVQSDIEKFNVLLAEMDAQVFYLNDYKYVFEGSGYIQLPRNLEVDGINVAK